MPEHRWASALISAKIKAKNYLQVVIGPGNYHKFVYIFVYISRAETGGFLGLELTPNGV